MKDFELRVGDDLFFLFEEGQGEPVVLLHGAPGDRRTFAGLVDRLGDMARVLTYTQRWFGAQDWRADGGGFGTRTHAADLIALSEVLDLRSVSLVAWSYSCQVALHAAGMRPDLFARLFLFEPGLPTWLDGEDLAAWQDDAASMFPPIAAALEAGDTNEAVRRLIDGSGGQGRFDSQPERLRRIHLDSREVLPLLFGGGEPPVRIDGDALRSLPVPAMIAWGKESRDLFAIPSRVAAGWLPGRHLCVEGADHLYPEKDPEGFASLVRTWLSAAPR